MKLTDEQIEILNAVKKGYPLIKVNAFAGTGKTTTLVEIAKANKDKKILYLAFNKAIQEEAKTKFPKNTEVKTTHALAFYYMKLLGYKNIKNNYRLTEIKEILNLDTFEEAKIISNYFEFYCNSPITDINSLSLNSSILNKLIEFFNLMENKEIDITHSFYLKLFELYLKKKKISIKPYDIVLLDEAQDTNDVTISIFNQIPSKQKILVGDKHQQIYSFRNSINAMNKIKGKELFLTHSFRFNETIANKANEILSTFKGENKKIKGVGKTKEIKTTAYISRTNSELIGIIDKLIRKNIKFKTIRNPYEIFALAMNVFKYVTEEKVDSNFTYLKKLSPVPDYGLLFEMALKTDDKELITAVNIAKKYQAKLFDLYQKTREFYYQNFDCNVFLTTAHTSKGLEWDRVIIEEDMPNLITNVIGKTFEELDENPIEDKDYLDEFISIQESANQKLIDEINLYYVALTRAKCEIIDKSVNENIFSLTKEEINKMIYFYLQTQKKIKEGK